MPTADNVVNTVTGNLLSWCRVCQLDNMLVYTLASLKCAKKQERVRLVIHTDECFVWRLSFGTLCGIEERKEKPTSVGMGYGRPCIDQRHPSPENGLSWGKGRGGGTASRPH